jgi:hypothetical protein
MRNETVCSKRPEQLMNGFSLMLTFSVNVHIQAHVVGFFSQSAGEYLPIGVCLTIQNIEINPCHGQALD